MLVYMYCYIFKERCVYTFKQTVKKMIIVEYDIFIQKVKQVES